MHTSPFPQLPIRTERLELRPLIAKDAKDIFAALEETREDLGRWLPWVINTKAVSDSDTFIHNCHAEMLLRKSMALGIFRGDDFLGVCGFVAFKWHIPMGEIGYWLRASARSLGYMREAVAALIRYGFKELRLLRIEINTLDDNLRSIRIAQQTGFALEARTWGLVSRPQDTRPAMGRRYVKFNEELIAG